MQISEMSASLAGINVAGMGQVEQPRIETWLSAAPEEKPEGPSTMTKVLVFGGAALFLFWAWSKFSGGSRMSPVMGIGRMYGKTAHKPKKRKTTSRRRKSRKAKRA